MARSVRLAFLLAALLTVGLVVARLRHENDTQAELIGKPAPEIDGDFALNGKPVKLADLKGKVVLLDFWAVWCPPCIETFPHLIAWDKEFKSKGLEIVGITSDYKEFGFDKEKGKLFISKQKLSKEQAQAMLKDFAAAHKLDYRLQVVNEENYAKLADTYKVEAIPQLVLIDRAGKIRLVKVGDSDENTKAIEKTIKELLAEAE